MVTHEVTGPADTRFGYPSQQPRPGLSADALKGEEIQLDPETLAAQQPDPQIAYRHPTLGEVAAGGQLRPLDQRQRVEGHRHPDRDPGGQARAARLVPHRQVPARREQTHHLLGGTDLGERLAHPELRRGAQPWAVRRTAVIKMGAGSDVGKAAPLRERAHLGEHRPLAEIAAITRIGPVARVGMLLGTQFHQFRANLIGDTSGGREFSASQAGRVGDGGEHGIGAKRSDGTGQHHGGVHTARKGHDQATQLCQPVQQSCLSSSGAEELRSAHGRRSSHARRPTGAREIVDAVVNAAPRPEQDPTGACGTGARTGEVAGIAHLDLDRRRRTAVPEVIFGDGKTAEQTLRLLAAARRGEPGFPALATRCSDGVLSRASDTFPTETVLVDPLGRTVTVGALPPARGFVAVVTAGTSDLPVAHEAIATLRALGAGHRLIVDVGVAGLHRLLAHLDELSTADCVIAVAGMEGTLPGVLTGLIRAPVVGVPTSVGYGVSLGGHVAAATMLASCAPGLSVVNIDNGFGAAAHAVKIVERVHGDRVPSD